MDDNTFSPEVPALLIKHLEHLKASAISIDVIKERGYRSISTKDDLEAAGFFEKQRLPGILIPIWGVDGTRQYNILRPDNPRKSKKKRKDGTISENVLKYEHPKGVGLRLDVPPRCTQYLKNPRIPLFIVEGTKKGDAVLSAGAECVVIISGVWGWKGTNENGGKTALPDFDFIAFNDRDVYVAMDSDLWTNINIGKAHKGLKGLLEYKKSRIHTLKLPEGKDGKKVGADDFLLEGHTLKDLVTLETNEKPVEEKKVIRQALRDFFTSDITGWYFLKKDSHGVEELPMANFVCRIIENLTLDDGLTQSRRFKIAGILTESREKLPLIEVPAGASFNSLNWINAEWGSKPFIFAGTGRNIKEQVLTNIYSGSQDAAYKTVFTHCGWREINGEMHFLTAAGSLGKPDIAVEVDTSLARYSLPMPAPNVSPVEAIKTSLDYMNIGTRDENQKVLIPIWATMYLAPLCEILDPAFTLWLHGRSGSFKSTITALALSHFGDFTDQNLPSSWHDTSNRIEQLLFWAKDLPLVVDDWAPGQNNMAAVDLEKRAEYIVREQGNHQGRGRMKLDSKGNPTYIPRGLLVITGEQLPNGFSHSARMLAIKLEAGDIDVAKMTEAQKSKEAYKTAMAHYILWLKERWPALKKNLPPTFYEYRLKANSDLGKDNDHPRVPAAMAWIYIGLDTGLSFATDRGALDQEVADMVRNDGWHYLCELAREQGQRVEKQKPSKRFVEVVKAIMNSGRTRIDDKDSESQSHPEPGITFIGWEDNEYLYLLPKIVYAAVRDFCQHTGEYFTWSDEAVWDDLKKAGCTKCDDGRITAVCWIGCMHRSIRFIKLKKSVLPDDEA